MLLILALLLCAAVLGAALHEGFFAARARDWAALRAICLNTRYIDSLRAG